MGPHVPTDAIVNNCVVWVVAFDPAACLLASASDYEYWARSAGFRSIRHRDITTNVKATWDVCGRIVTQPNISGLLEKMPEHIRTFAGSFQAMKKAFDAGATNYVMLTARKPWLYLTPGDCGRAMIS